MEVIKIGETVPDVVFKFLGPEGLTNVKSSELFRGKRIAVFGLPGAYTPVCSAKHLPDFVADAEELMKKQIDGIVCISVNDPFVMKAWGDEHGAENKVHMMADHQCEFTRAIGLVVDLNELGCGERSERYSMIVNDNSVESIHVEKDFMACELSSVESLIKVA
jgi:peroxiredoxin|tara:strand:+ start:58 stop:546 length:489 start_codon:yes stop_codon:yes gene_type:complete